MSVVTCIEDVDRSLKACQATSAEEDMKSLCQRWQASLAKFVEAYRGLSAFNDNWREEVFRGTRAYEPSRELMINNLFQGWLKLNNEAEKWIVVLASQRCNLDVAAEYQRCVNEAKDTLSEWTPPRLSDDPILREMILNRSQSKKIKDLVGSDW